MIITKKSRLGKRALLGLSLACGCILATAQAAPAETRLGIAEVVALAIGHNLSLRRGAVDLEAAKRQSAYAAGAFFPSISASVGLAMANNANDPSGNSLSPGWSVPVSYGVSLALSPGVLLDIEAARTNYAMGLLSYASASRSLEKSVRAAFYALLLQRESIRLEEASVERGRRQLEQVEASYKAGLVPDLDLMIAQVALDAHKPVLNGLNDAFTQQMGQFKQLLGLEADRRISLVGDLEPLATAPSLMGIGSGGDSLELQALRLGLEATERKKRSQQLSAWLPTLSLGWSGQPVLGEAFSASQRWSDASGGLSLGLSFSPNALFPWTSAAEAIAQLEDQARKARLQIEEQSRAQAFNRESYIAQMRQSLQALESLDAAARLAQRAYDLSLDAYRLGAKDLVSLQSAEGDLQRARYNVLSERLTLLTTALSLEYEDNLPFGTVLGGKK